MNDFLQVCSKFSKLDEAATDDLLGCLKSLTMEKGGYLLKSRSVCRNLYFINEGLVKTFFNKDDKEFIMRFFPENSLFTVLDSYIQQTPSNYMILALEPTSFISISYPEMENLCRKHHSIETFFRRLVSLAALNLMKRVSEMLEEKASARYDNFIKENPGLLQRISLGDLANYLGITQASLSRIRANK